MRNHLYIGQALWVVAEYCDQLGELDSWLLQIAAEAARVRNWRLARLAIATFQDDRRLGDIEERALGYLSALIWREELGNNAYIPPEGESVVLELQEELEGSPL